jgi:glycosyltransferase involved in cell wall biosynthesis
LRQPPEAIQLNTSASILLCTRDPRRDYLRRVLDALRSQTLPREKWELLIIDNGSSPPLASELDLSGLPRGRVIRHDEPGKASALSCGIERAEAQLLVVVDDDNVLADDYLERALEIGEKRPTMGCWSGSIAAEFERSPAAWTQPYLRYLAIREVKAELWSNFSDPAHYSWLPWGAGMVIRRDIALVWAGKTRSQRTARAFERLGSGCGGEDVDMALTACDLGYGTGLFACLKLTHLIRSERVEEPYLLKLMEGMNYSLRALAAHRGQPLPRLTLPRLVWGHLRALTRGLREFRLYRACCRGGRAAEREFQSQKKTLALSPLHSAGALQSE